MILTAEQDPLGRALIDFFQGKEVEPVLVRSDTASDDHLPAELFFRTWEEMPPWEQLAIEKCKGRVLDIGAGAGCHSLVLQERGHEVVALDISPGAVYVMEQRGVRQVHLGHVFDMEGETFDTLLLMMNGIGVVGDIKGLEHFLSHAVKLLNPGGQILMDSSDISYLFTEGAPEQWPLPTENYFGEVRFQMSYQYTLGDSFKWLYVDFDTLYRVAWKLDYFTEKLMDGTHHEYLARLQQEQEA